MLFGLIIFQSGMTFGMLTRQSNGDKRCKASTIGMKIHKLFGILWAILLVCTLISSFLNIYDLIKTISIINLLLFLLTGIFVSSLLPHNIHKQLQRGDFDKFAGKQGICVGENGLTVATSTTSNTIEYSHVERVCETEHALYLQLEKPLSVIPIPKFAFQNLEERSVFTNAVQSRILNRHTF